MNAAQLAAGGIKSIQRGTLTILVTDGSAVATISAVVTAKSELRMLGFSTTATSLADTPRIALGSTTVTATRESGGAAVTVSWEVTERY